MYYIDAKHGNGGIAAPYYKKCEVAACFVFQAPALAAGHPTESTAISSIPRPDLGMMPTTSAR